VDRPYLGVKEELKGIGLKKGRERNRKPLNTVAQIHRRKSWKAIRRGSNRRKGGQSKGEKTRAVGFSCGSSTGGKINFEELESGAERTKKENKPWLKKSNGVND